MAGALDLMDADVSELLALSMVYCNEWILVRVQKCFDTFCGRTYKSIGGQNTAVAEWPNF